MKKETRVAKAYKLHQKGLKVKETAEKMQLKERVVRAYLWRAQNPTKYAELLKRYRSKKKAKQASTQPPATQN